MKRFSYIDARTVEDIAAALSSGDAAIIAGGTDILNLLKSRSRPNPPRTVVNVKNIAELIYIKEDDAVLKIGAMSRLCEIEENEVIKDKYPVLSEAASAVASPQIRNMGTIGGNICQETRCWYYRYPENVFDCLRKGGQACYAMMGENRFHSIYGGVRVSDPACRSSCPGSINIPAYLTKAREGLLDEAAEIILESNPIPAVTGRVCPHFCQQGCNRNDFDQPVSIRNIERFIGDHILEHPERFIRPPQKETGHRVAIIGSGPAGLSAAHYLRKSGHHVTVFERMEHAGGMLAYAIPPYRLPDDIVRRVLKAIENTGVDFKLKVNVGEDVTLGALQKDFDSVFLATGAWDQPAIGLDGEHLTVPGLTVLKEGRQWRDQVAGKKVLVIGGGNVAIDVGVTAIRLGAAQVTLACLESRPEMPAYNWEIEQAIAEGLKLMPSWGPSKVMDRDANVTGMELVRCVSVFDPQGNFRPTLDDSVKKVVEADLILMAVGQKTDLSYLDADFSLNIERGLITVDCETQATGINGLFAGGDVTTGPASVIEAIAAGRKAAHAIDRTLRGEEYLQVEGIDAVCKPVLSSSADYLNEAGPASMPAFSPAERSLDAEDKLGLEWDQVHAESNRCFNCRCVAVSPSDMAPALIALDAKIKTNMRTVAAENFFSAGLMTSTIMEPDELVIGIEIPKPQKVCRQAFLKFRVRKTMDFPVVGVAVVLSMDKDKVKDARIALSGVAPIPWRSDAAEAAITGKKINAKNAGAAGEAAITTAVPLGQNRYIVPIVKTMVKRAILASK